jgi:hypothetical protein
VRFDGQQPEPERLRLRERAIDFLARSWQLTELQQRRTAKQCAFDGE